MKNIEEEIIEFINTVTVEDIICIQCRKYQIKYGEKPSFIAVNVALASNLKHHELCSPVVGFTPLAGQREDARYLMLGDEQGRYKEFL